jgi:hypothetical protein
MPYLLWYMGEMAKLQPGSSPPPVDEVVETFCLLGTAKECAARIEALRTEHGIGEVITVPGIGGMSLDLTGRVITELGAAGRDG